MSKKLTEPERHCQRLVHRLYHLRNKMARYISAARWERVSHLSLDAERVLSAIKTISTDLARK